MCNDIEKEINLIFAELKKDFEYKEESLLYLNFIAIIEEKYDIEIPSRFFSMEIFKDKGKMAKVIHMLIEEKTRDVKGKTK